MEQFLVFPDQRIGGEDEHIAVQVPALKELSSIAERFNTMTARLRERELRLKKARQKWETVFRAIGGPAMVLSPDFRIVEHNEILQDMFESEYPDKTMPGIRGKKCFEKSVFQMDSELKLIFL